VQRELAYARRIHEKVFPQRIDNGPVLFDFRYQPMRQIGGDFVDVIRETREDGKGGAVSVVLVDVTGHGIAAALAVNRLHGEIKRALAQGGGGATQPGKIIASLNEYVHLTLANEGCFATALVARLDPARGELRWASAGHPPAFLRRRSPGGDGRIERLDATAMLLGPLEPADFDACEARASLGAGDVLIAYTDGTIECRNRDDRQLGLDGFQQIVAEAFNAAQGNSSAALDMVLQSLAAHRWGAADDDTLVLAATVVGVQTNHGHADEQIAAAEAEAVSSEARP
jgi:serine phosphatase RsbU (regulator of sigma subunit)